MKFSLYENDVKELISFMVDVRDECLAWAEEREIELLEILIKSLQNGKGEN